MNGSNMRDKARAIFGKTFFENTKEPAPAKNGAVALQKRANARPIPTYKVGGVVKKQNGGALTAAEKARAEAMIKQSGDAAMRDPLVMRYLDEQNRAPMGVPGMGPKPVKKKAEGGLLDRVGRYFSDMANEDDRKRYGRPVTSFKRSKEDSTNNPKNKPASKADVDSSAPKTQTVTPSAPKTQTVRLPEDKKKYVRLNEKRKYVKLDPSVMKKGGAVKGKPKDGLAVMIAIGKPMKGMKKPTKRAEGGNIEAQRLEARADAGRYKDGGKIAKKASGGMSARSDRDVIVAKARGPKNEIIVQPVKRAVGGAGKTRKGQMKGC